MPPALSTVPAEPAIETPKPTPAMLPFA